MFSPQSRIIVTGGAGFIGSALVRRLAAMGARVTVLDNLWRGSLDNLRGEDGTPAIDLDRDFQIADLADYGRCMEAIRDADWVYHLADVVGGVQYVFERESFVFRQNILINSNVLSACMANGIPNYVYVGTACSFPKHLQMAAGIARLHEDATYPAEPESSYGWSKLMGEYEAELARHSGKLNVGLLRFHNVYGPGASFEPRRAQALPSLIRKAVLHPGEPFVVWGSGEQYRDFVYIDDIIDALLRVAERGMNQGVIQVGSEHPTTIREAAALVVKISGKPIEPVFDRTKPEGDRGRVAVCDRAREILGWSATTPLETGLANTYRWVESHMRAGAR